MCLHRRRCSRGLRCCGFDAPPPRWVCRWPRPALPASEEALTRFSLAGRAEGGPRNIFASAQQIGIRAHHNANADAERDRMLSTMGIVVVRFENFHIRQNLRGVVTIRELVLSRAALLREPRSDDDDEEEEDDWQRLALPDSEKARSASSLAGRVVSASGTPSGEGVRRSHNISSRVSISVDEGTPIRPQVRAVFSNAVALAGMPAATPL